MVRWVIVASLLCLPLAASGKKEMSGSEASGNKQDCAAMLRSKAAIPAKMAELLMQVADNFEMHSKAMHENKDMASKKEADYMLKLAKQQREAAETMKKMANEMRNAHFAAVPHGQAVMDKMPSNEAMIRQAQLERQVANLLKQDAASIDKMTASTKGSRTEKPPK